jgi:YesN/AraC family two-component response regulator
MLNFSKGSKEQLKIEITDEGLGIPQNQQKYILKRYYRARNVINSQRPGTGLGLVMVKKLIEASGGSINFKSKENKGTTFTILLKNLEKKYKQNAISNNDTIQELTETHEDQFELDEFSDSKVLIVEDNDELREILVKTLGVYFQIFEADNGKKGLKIASQVFPDIILTDLIMPEMDGMEMSAKIKDDINLNHIPIFMLSVLQNSVQKLESIESGISEYIEKPVDIKFLLAKMTNTLKWQKTLQKKYIHENDSDNASIYRNKNDQNFFKNLEITIIENLENNSFSVHDLSDSLGMSRTSLYMKLKNLVDLSPQDFIIHTKLKLAKKLLIKGEYSIKEVAYSSGFSNPKYFSTSFKKFYDTTPTAFLESLQKDTES